MKSGTVRVESRAQRADIQSLRALAVGLVIVNHLRPNDIPGGYLGVDVFFVISGFLITSHLRREADTTGTVNLARFWARRAKRLLPAAILVLVASAAITYWLLPITSVRQVLGEIGAAGGYFLNWVLAANSQDYFAQDGVSPVTHYWSLSVEEQFYLVWPVLILFGLFVSRRRSSRFRYWTLLGTLAVVFLGSFAWAIWSVASEPNAAYFQTTGRAWEFAAGGLIAFLPARRAKATAAMSMLSWLLWGALLGCAFAYGPASGFPGMAALIPVAATSVLIAIGDGGPRWAPQRVFAWRPVQFIGDISYSLYLWHWPLIVAVTAIAGTLSRLSAVGVVLVTVVLAWATKRYVEDPVRFAKGRMWKTPARVLAATVATVAILLGGSAAATASITVRAQQTAEALYQQSLAPSECFGAQAQLSESSCPQSHELLDELQILGGWGIQNASVSNGTYCQQERGNAEVLSCTFGMKDGEQAIDVALVGDSHAGMWATAFDAIARSYGLRITTYLNSACPVTLDPRVAAAGPSPTHQAACATWRESVVREIAEDQTIDVVATTARDRAYSFADGSPDDGSGYRDAWQSWLDSGKSVVVVNDPPIHQASVPECIARSQDRVDPCTIPSSAMSPPSPMQVAAAGIADPKFAFVDYTEVFCDPIVCHSVIGGIPVYLDNEHLTAAFARSFGSSFLADVTPTWSTH
ncbi:acyltransferase family protein [Microbacterium algeriense]|uniref:Acyltransferase n=1 Tax=Microbacterium algeriense TaxID=2615184 RepID=A0ABQ6VAB7_9MICO|nr:acyltransferase family protein [Microbacterium algeriense]KAB1867345.1 acyltransferase [Microbacterium algeriense]